MKNKQANRCPSDTANVFQIVSCCEDTKLLTATAITLAADGVMLGQSTDKITPGCTPVYVNGDIIVVCSLHRWTLHQKAALSFHNVPLSQYPRSFFVILV
jgi:hypothetical protein